MSERECPTCHVGTITTDPAEAETCCGIERDEKGRCVYRPHHPVYISEVTG